MKKQKILSRPITSNGIESVIGKLTTNELPGPDGITNDFFHTFKANLIVFFSKYSKILKRKHFQTPSTKSASHWYQITDTTIKKKIIEKYH